MRWPPEEDLDLDTDARSSTQKNWAPKNWALWAAMAMLAAGTLAVLYVFFAAASKPEPSTGLARFATGEMRQLSILEAPPPMPTRALQDATGGETSLAVYRGEVTVLNLWATWCAPCMEEMPTLGELQRRYQGRLHVVPVSVDSEADRQKARDELARLTHGSLPFYIDISRAVLFDAAAAGMPTTIVYDRHGREVARLAGGADWSSNEAAALMDAVLARE
jgi:thiol-disulfide isomerase/thioredoxin